MKLWLVKWLVYLTDVARAPSPNEATENFLVHAYLNDGFKQWLATRERTLKNYIATRVEGGPLPNDKLILALGQLQEVANLQQYAASAFKKKQLEKDKAKLSTALQNKNP